MVAALSLLVGRDLLPRQEEEANLIRRMVDLGAVDGVTGKADYSVDSMDLVTHSQALSRLHELLAQKGILPEGNNGPLASSIMPGPEPIP